MNALRFAAGGRELAGVLHPGSRDTGVLICSPFGQEAVRVQRLQRVLAERLATKGHSVLRFDWFATGESMGEDGEGELRGWQDDLLAADARLRASGCATVLWFGIRLGATLAALAAAGARPAPRGLILWEPVLDGAAYLRELRADHERALAFSYGPLRRDPGIDHGPEDQAIGFAIGSALRQQLDTLKAVARPRGIPTLVLAPPGAAALGWPAGADAEVAPAVRHQAFGHDFDWTSEEALNTALVPAEALRQILQGVETLS